MQTPDYYFIIKLQIESGIDLFLLKHFDVIVLTKKKKNDDNNDSDTNHSWST